MKDLLPLKIMTPSHKRQIVAVCADEEHQVIKKKLAITSSPASTQSLPPAKPPLDSFELLITEILEKNNPQRDDHVAANIAAFFHKRYSNFLVLNDDDVSSLESAIWASNLLLNHVCALVEPSVYIVDVAVKQLDEYIFPRLQLLSKSSQTLRVNEVAILLTWLTHYQDQLEQKFPETLQSRNQVEYMEELFVEYIKRGVHEPLNQMIHRSLEMNTIDGVDHCKDGHFSTQLPQDVAVFLNSQLCTAKSSLPRRFFSDVVKGCQEELFNMVGVLMLQIETRWQDLTVEYLCSIISDSQRLVEIVEGIFGSVTATESQQELTEDLISELIQLSVLANRYLCELRFLDLKDTFFNFIGGPEWSNGELPVEDTIAELRDFLADVKGWIQGDFYHGKVLKLCFDIFLQSYIASFLSNTMGKGIKHSQNAAEIMERDFVKLSNFFCVELLEEHGRHGFYSHDAINNRLQILCSFARILVCLSPKAIEADIENVCQQFGFDKGTPIVLHVAALRSRTRLTAKASKEWHIQLWRTGMKLTMQGVNEDSFYHVPDMRNSCVIRRVRPLKSKNSPEGTKLPTSRLVKGTRVSKLVSRSKRVIGSDRTLLTDWKHDSTQLKTNIRLCV